MRKVKILGKNIPIWLLATVLLCLIGIVVAVTYFGTIRVPWKITPTPPPAVTVTMSPETVSIPELSIQSGQTSTYVSEGSLAQITVSGGTASVTAELAGDLTGFSAFTATVMLTPTTSNIVVDGELDDGYTLVAVDESSEMGNLPIKVYVACDEDYMYWFFEAINPTTEEEGIGDANILWNRWLEEEDTYLIVYLQEDVYDYEGVWTGTPMADAELARHTYMEGNVEICDALEAKIPRSYADFLGWVYDVSSKAGMQDRNTSWGTVHYGDIGSSDWIDSPYKLATITFELGKASRSCTQTVPEGEYNVYLEISATAVTTDSLLTGTAQIDFSYE